MIHYPFSYHCSLVYFIFCFFLFRLVGSARDRTVCFFFFLFSFFFLLSSVRPRLFVSRFSLFTYHFSLFFGPSAAKRETKEKNEYKVVVFLLDLGESVEKPFFPCQIRRLRSVPLGTTDRKPREKTLTKCGKPIFGVLSAGQSAADRGRWRDKIRCDSVFLSEKSKALCKAVENRRPEGIFSIGFRKPGRFPKVFGKQLSTSPRTGRPVAPFICRPKF